MKIIIRWWKVFLIILLFDEILIISLGLINDIKLQFVPLGCLIGLFLFIRLTEPNLK
jgi:hypothetical protein